MKKQEIIHKSFFDGGYLYECGGVYRADGGDAPSRRLWGSVTCKNCLRCRPAKKEKGLRGKLRQ